MLTDYESEAEPGNERRRCFRQEDSGQSGIEDGKGSRFEKVQGVLANFHHPRGKHARWVLAKYADNRAKLARRSTIQILLRQLELRGDKIRTETRSEHKDEKSRDPRRDVQIFHS